MKQKNAPMAAAPIRYNLDGSVAWDQMWSAFCELAIEGGPPHRGTLLSPDGKHQKSKEKYHAVIQEITRAYQLLIPYAVVEGEHGWIGVRFPAGNLARWYMTIIKNENVECRRDKSTLFLPVHASYTIEKEIKNLITVVAKAYHYWRDHRTPAEKFFVIALGFDARWKILYNKSLLP